MIKNQNDIEEYKNYNKVYIPNDYINENWIYRFNGDYIDILTNENCRVSYNTTYCDCRKYNYKTNVITNKYECTTSGTQTQVIPYTSISNNINDSIYIRERYIQDKGLIIGIFIIAIIFTILLARRGAYR